MFKEKLNQAMVDLKLNQSKLCELTGIGKSSISHYLSSKNIPTEDRQREMAEALGLNPDYFDEELENKEPVSYTTIKKLLPEQAGKLIGISKDTVRKAYRTEVFLGGIAVDIS